MLILRKRGYSNYFANHILEERYKDLFLNKNTTIKEKVWAQKRGFLSDKIAFYGLTEDNYRDYLADFDYWKMHPINGIYSKWIDDKLTTKLILQPFSEYLPEYYYQVGNGEVLKLMDCPPGYGGSEEDLIILLKEKRYLASKLLAGTFAQGFFKLSYENEDFLINDRIVSLEDLVELIGSWIRLKNGGYLITEYLHTHSELGKIWNKTPNTLRLLVIKENGKSATLRDSFFRFGSSKTGVIDNATNGGIACHVNVQNGEFSRPIRLDGHHAVESEYHPDTGVLILGTLPHWDLIETKLIEISEYIPQLLYLGYDIVITDEGFKIIEINSHQGIKFPQIYCPIFKNPLLADFFTRLLD